MLPFSISPGMWVFQKHSGDSGPGIPGAQAQFPGNSLSSFTDYEENSVVTAFSVYMSVTTFSFHKEGGSTLFTPAAGV